MALLVRISYIDRESKLLAAIISVLALFCSCDGSLTVKPVNIEAVVGQRVQLKCSTSQPYYVLWDHASVGSTSRSYIFFSGVLVLPYSQRFQLDRDNATGAYNLVIPSVQKEDAGNYRCMDMVGHGEQAEAELIVLDSSPQCATDVIQFCERTSQDFETSCTVGFRGNLVPKIECSSSGVTTSSSVANGQTQDSVTYSLRLTAHWPLDDGHPIICRTSISHVSSIVNPIVMYAFGSNQTLTIDRRETVDCKVNSSEQCSYHWIHKDTGLVISGSQTLRADEAGQYTCKATCRLRDEICAVIPLVAYLTAQEAITDTDQSYVPIAIGVTVGGISLLILAGVLVIVCYWMKRHRRMKRCQNENRDPEESVLCLDTIPATNGTTCPTSPERNGTNGNALRNCEKAHKQLNVKAHSTSNNSDENVNGDTQHMSENLHKDVNGNARHTSENSNKHVNGNARHTSENSNKHVNGNARHTSENSNKHVNGNARHTSENSHKDVNSNACHTSENSNKHVNGIAHTIAEKLPKDTPPTH